MDDGDADDGDYGDKDTVTQIDFIQVSVLGATFSVAPSTVGWLLVVTIGRQLFTINQ